jgi:beta-N-acetylhexosaminidase
MVDLHGCNLSQEEREMLSHPMVGGVILFTRNYQSVEQLRALIQDIHQIRSPRLLVAVDQEGGRVQRFRDEFVRLPAVSRLGQLYQENPKYARHCSEITGWLMASELLAVGVDISFAPVLDLDYGVSTVIGDRAFHRSAEVVADLAHSYMSGMRKAGMSATGKHFPGHGAVHADSHTDLPVDDRLYVDLVNEDMLSFERMIHYDMAAMMMAHVVYPQVDDRPASFSPVWIQEILRNQLGFQGAVFSDDLSMVAAHSIGSYAERARQAMHAGCDMVLVCNNTEGRDEVLDNLAELDNPVSHLRLVRMHGKHDISWEQLHQSREWRDAVKLIGQYDLEPLLDMDIE